MAATLVAGQKYQTRMGLLTYTGLYTHYRRCDRCNIERKLIHEFLEGDYPHHTCAYYYGTECVKELFKGMKP